LLRAIVICPDADLVSRLSRALMELGEVTVARSMQQYPETVDLVRTLRAHAPDVIFLSFENLEKAAQIVRFLETEAKGVQIIAVDRIADAKILRVVMKAGLREMVTDPFDRALLVEALKGVRNQIVSQPVQSLATDQIFSFLPSKAGVGASTLALNVSGAMSRRPDSRVLLSDFDLNSGMMVPVETAKPVFGCRRG
jgi:Flp pilus assembly CpaE family ATPase